MIIEDNLNDILNSMTFAQKQFIHLTYLLKILCLPFRKYSKILLETIYPCQSNIQKLPNTQKLQNSGNIDKRIIFCLHSENTSSGTTALHPLSLVSYYYAYWIRELDKVHHILSINQKYIARNDDYCMYIPQKL